MATPTPTTNTPQKHLPAFSSPAPRSVPAMMNFESPAALGLLGEGGVNMSLTMSGLGMSSLGISASAMGRADEEERRRRLDTIISTLKAKPGRVSLKGILDLCHQEGLEVAQEPDALVLMIGSEGIVEIPLQNGEIATDRIILELVHDRHNYAATASKILGGSLRPVPGMAKINLSLERFAHNLDKLLRMDRLSSPQNGGISCYQAIFGVYASLKKLFEHEKKMALALMDAGDALAGYKAEREVLCKKSGRPRINARDCLGLSLEYWMDRRSLFPPSNKAQSSEKEKDKMDIDASTTEYPEDADPQTHTIYSLTIECESSQSSMYTPIRISDAWLSDAVEKAPNTANPDLDDILNPQPASAIDWQEPPPTYLPPADANANDAMNLDNAPGRLPNIRFIAKLNPPLTVPWSAYVNIQNALGLAVSNDIFRATTFVGLELRPAEMDPGLAAASLTTSEANQELSVEKRVLVVGRDGEESESMHKNGLYTPRVEYARTIDALPFSHPRQLVEILPVLRQYAFTTSLMKRMFGTASQKEKGKVTAPVQQGALMPQRSADGEAEQPLQIDTTLFYAVPTGPRLRFDIPYPSSSSTSTSSTANPTSPSSSHTLQPSSAAADILSQLLSTAPGAKPPLNITLEVHPNAELVVTETNVVDADQTKIKDGSADVSMELGSDEDEAYTKETKRIARALDVCGDVGVWSEWVRREVRRKDAGGAGSS